MEVGATRTRRRLGVWFVWGFGFIAIVGTLLLEARVQSDRPELAVSPVVIAVYFLAFGCAAAVGAALVLGRDGHTVGRAFLALAVSLAAGLGFDLYARYGALVRPNGLPAAATVAHLVDPVFLAFFATIAFALHRIPTGVPLSPRWALASRITVGSAVVAYVGGALSNRPIDPPFEAVRNPLALPGASAVLDVMRGGGSMLTAIGLLVGAASLVVRFRRSTTADRRRWLGWSWRWRHFRSVWRWPTRGGARTTRCRCSSRPADGS